MASLLIRTFFRPPPLLLPSRTSPHLLSPRSLPPPNRKPTYIPPTTPYELSDLAQDLVYFARYMLVPGGRLVFFLPTVTDEYADVDVPRARGMRVVGNSLQDFGKWGRRVRFSYLKGFWVWDLIGGGN